MAGPTIGEEGGVGKIDHGVAKKVKGWEEGVQEGESGRQKNWGRIMTEKMPKKIKNGGKRHSKEKKQITKKESALSEEEWPVIDVPRVPQREAGGGGRKRGEVARIYN